MNNQRTDDMGFALAIVFLGGAAAGMLMGLLLAPKSGEQTRRDIRSYTKRTEEEVIEKAKEARAALDEVIDRGRQFVKERRADVQAALQTGKEAIQEAQEKYGR